MLSTDCKRVNPYHFTCNPSFQSIRLCCYYFFPLLLFYGAALLCLLRSHKLSSILLRWPFKEIAFPLRMVCSKSTNSKSIYISIACVNVLLLSLKILPACLILGRLYLDCLWLSNFRSDLFWLFPICIV